jgi:phosphinothricin acetyltransferase
MNVVPCTPGRHLEAIRGILNEAILNTTANWSHEARTVEAMTDWFEAKAKMGHPILGVEAGDGTLMGYATYGTFREHSGYKYTVEHSIYVDGRFRGRGVGGALLGAVIAEAEARDRHMLIGAIDASNPASIALHRKFGFTRCATIREAGFKFGRWLDVEFHQLILRTPVPPADRPERAP